MRTKPRRRRGCLTAAITVLALVCAAALWIRWGNTAIQTTHTDLTFTRLPQAFDGCRIAVLSDTQSQTFGDDQQRLLQAVTDVQPDLIFFVGDLTDRFRGVPEDYVRTLGDGLSAIAPTYYVTGNHEWALGEVPALKKTLADCGVTVLSNAAAAVEWDGETLLIAGVDDPNGYADQKSPETLATEIYAQYGDAFWILLAHRNDLFDSRYSLLGADLVVSGHAHGGVIRLPFRREGLLSHDGVLFPQYTAGLYEENGSALFVTRGLGNTPPSFRIFNRPEVAVLTLHRAER